jgi:hypothetical protein
MSIEYTRSQRRLMKRLSDEIDLIACADCEWFAEHSRQHRIRPASDAEIDMMAMTAGGNLITPPGRQLYAAIKRVAVDVCTSLRVYVMNDADFDPDVLDEETCRAVFETAAPPEAMQAEAAYLRARAG